MPKYHLAIKTFSFKTAFRNRREYAEAWWALRRAFPRVLASTLMPDHAHMALETDQPQIANLRFALVLGLVSRRHHPGERIWGPVSPPKDIPNRSHLWRQIRYIHLNPCRDGLTRDPLEWEWSTHRDLVGAARPAWMELKGIDPESFHAYVSGDPSVKVGGTAPPRVKSRLVASLDEMRHAVLLATHELSLRKAGRDQPRKVFVALVRALGYPRTEEVARFMGVCPKTVWNLARAPLSFNEANQLQAARLVLSDPRLNFLGSGVQAQPAGGSALNFPASGVQRIGAPAQRSGM